MANVEEKLEDHSVKIAKLETDYMNFKESIQETIRDLKENDLREIKDSLKDLSKSINTAITLMATTNTEQKNNGHEDSKSIAKEVNAIVTVIGWGWKIFSRLPLLLQLLTILGILAATGAVSNYLVKWVSYLIPFVKG